MYKVNSDPIESFLETLDNTISDQMNEVVMHFQNRVDTTLSIPDIGSLEVGSLIYDSTILKLARSSFPLLYRIFMRAHVHSLLEIFPEQMNDAIHGATRDLIDEKGLSEGDTGFFGEEDMAQLIPAMLWRLGNYSPKSGVNLVKKGIEVFYTSFEEKQYIRNGYTLTVMRDTIIYLKTHKLSTKELIDLVGVDRASKNPS